jgi:hypothetical protein
MRIVTVVPCFSISVDGTMERLAVIYSPVSLLDEFKPVTLIHTVISPAVREPATASSIDFLATS